jgi:transposase
MQRLARTDGHAWRNLRIRAEKMFAAGKRQSEIARKLHVSRQCVHNWFWHWQGGDGTPTLGLRHAGSGRKAKLDRGQLTKVEDALRRGPQAFGYRNRRWTLWRVATVIERVTGVHYHQSSVWRILRGLGWSLRRPPKRKQKPAGYIPREWAAPVKQGN